MQRAEHLLQDLGKPSSSTTRMLQTASTRRWRRNFKVATTTTTLNVKPVLFWEFFKAQLVNGSTPLGLATHSSFAVIADLLMQPK